MGLDLFNVWAKLSLDSRDYDRAIQDSKGKIDEFATKAAMGMKAVGAAVGTVANAVIDVGKQAFASYADYEQLVGGVETLFGAGGKSIEEYAASVGKTVDEARTEYDSLIRAQTFVLNKSSGAFESAGLSANQYMETVTGFSASLIQSLGGDTEKAARYADMAIVDMSDNANKMGSSMESIQNAYQGFAKQNYTMLDNLKLGYGGTKSEMERLVEDAEKLNSSFKAQRDETGKLTLAYSDVVDAIHIVQTNMGITGTTADEAAGTISGSINMMKAAWQNLVTNMAIGGVQLTDSINDLVYSVKTVIGNVVPLILKMAPDVVDGLARLFSELAPIVIEEITNAIPTILDALQKIFDTALNLIIDNLPTIVNTAVGAVAQIAQGLGESLPTLIPAIVDMVAQIVQTLIDNAPMLLTAALALVTGLAEGLINSIPVIIEALPQIVDGMINFFSEAIPQIIDTGIKLLSALVEAMPQIIEAIEIALPQIMESLQNFFLDETPKIVESGTKLLSALVEDIPTIIENVVNLLPEIIDAMVKFFTTAMPQIIDAGIKLLTALVDNLPQIISAIVDVLPQIITSIVQALIGMMPVIIQAGVTLLTALIQNLPQIIVTIVQALPSIISSIVSGLLQALPQIASAGVQLFSALIQSMPSILYNIISGCLQIGSTIIQELGNFVGKMSEVGVNLMRGLVDGLWSMVSWVGDTISNIGNWIIGGVKGIFGINSPSKVFAEIGNNLALGLGEGYEDAMEGVGKDIQQLSEEAIPTINATATGTASAGFGAVGAGGIVININGDVYDDEWSMRTKMKDAILDVIQTELAYG